MTALEPPGRRDTASCITMCNALGAGRQETKSRRDLASYESEEKRRPGRGEGVAQDNCIKLQVVQPEGVESLCCTTSVPNSQYQRLPRVSTKIPESKMCLISKQALLKVIKKSVSNHYLEREIHSQAQQEPSEAQ